jgi:hypothetical protein
MLIHLVVFQYKTETTEAERREHREKLKALAGLEGVLALQVGEDVVHSARSYDTGLVMRFPDRAALDAYQKNPQHVPVAQLGVSLSSHIVAVDFLE